MLNVNLNTTNQNTATPPLTVTAQESSLPEPVMTLLNDTTKLEAPYSPETLQALLQKQKAALRSTPPNPGNVESNISDAMLEAIGKSTEDLSILQGWTEGGAAMFNSANKVMFETLKKLLQSSDETKKGFAREDLFQLAVIDFMANNENIQKEIKDNMAHYLESTGSGSHGIHEGWNGQKFADELQSVWGHIKTHSQENSLSKEILNILDQNGGIDALKTQYTSKFDDANGYAFRDNLDTGNYGLSPMLRLAVMAKFLTKNPDIVQADLEMFMTGTVKDIEDLISKHLGGSITLKSLLTEGEGGWKIIDGVNGTGKIVDWTGVGLDLNYFTDLYTKFPSRVLGDEDLKEINRIGDNVKMIMQSLKYWYQILRDERVAIARNMS
ncbi:molecular chaperone [Grimontia hollisae]|uniref:molecular chaperone n=1 Tax=Grimontia hollisae TaxID=673 RepID=UPI00130374A8|nr:molecular chaperone [Grimontia hollisae]